VKAPRTGSVRRPSELSSVHLDAMEMMKDQLIIVLIERLGGQVSIPVEEIDTVPSGKALHYNVINRVFNFRVKSRGS